MLPWNAIPDKETIEATMIALTERHIETFLVHDANEAKKKVLELLPPGVEVMNMTSMSVFRAHIPWHVNESRRFRSIRNVMRSMNPETQRTDMLKLESAPEWVIGSVQAVTKDGTIIIASTTGNQIPAYAYGSRHVIWIVGVQKIVNSLVDAFARIYEYCLPKESERARREDPAAQIDVNKLLIINKEVQLGRCTLIFTKRPLGF